VLDRVAEARGVRPRVVFLEASDETLLNRFRETRRPHPLSDGASVLQGIEREREELSDVRERADVVIDTTGLNVWELRRRIGDTLVSAGRTRLRVQFVSFGYKHGVPRDADLLFDVRFLKNPHYEPELAPLGEQRCIEREGREGGVPAQDSGGEKQLPLLRGSAPKGEITGQQAHHHRACDVLEQGVVRQSGAEKSRAAEVDAVPERGADPAANKDNEKSRELMHVLRPSLQIQGDKKAALRRLADRVLPPRLSGRSHQRRRTWSVCSPVRLSGEPHSHRGKANGRPMPGQRHLFCSVDQVSSSRELSAGSSAGSRVMAVKRIEAEPSGLVIEFDHAALIIIDMQRDFLEPGGFGETLGNNVALLKAAVPPLQGVLAAARKAGMLIIHTREGHRPDLSDAPRHKVERGEPSLRIGAPGPMGRILVRGEPGHDIISELYPAPGEPVIDKPGKGAFYQTDLELMLKNREIDTLLVCGVTTEVCVNTTVREANDRGFRCIVLSDCCASYFPEFHAAGLAMIKAQGGIFGWVTASPQILAALDSL
jgi:nicotinamidase-related amidase